VWLRVVNEAPTITKTDLVTIGQVPGRDQSVFAEHAKAAKEECPVSVALAGVHVINLDATLALAP
jgi:osmotically inducible protein OsmC